MTADPLYLVYVAFTALAGLLAGIAIRAPRSTALRAAAVGLTAAFLPVAYFGINENLARPKPATHEWFMSGAKQASVLGVSLDEGKAIYLWLRVDGALEPRYYRLPWRTQDAEKLQSAVQQAADEDGIVRLYNPFSRDSWTNQGAINIEIVPPPTPPMKHPPPPRPRIFNPRDRMLQSSL